RNIDAVRTGKLEPWNLILLYPVFGPRPHDGVFTLEIDASGKLFLKKKVHTAADYTDNPMIFFEAFKNYMRIYARFFNELGAASGCSSRPDALRRLHQREGKVPSLERMSRLCHEPPCRDQVLEVAWSRRLALPPNKLDHDRAKKRKHANSTGTLTAGAPNNKTVVRDADRPVFHLFTDASNTDIGGVFYCGKTAQSDWRRTQPLPQEQMFACSLYPNERSHHIDVTETIAIATAIKKWAYSWRHATLIIHTYNTTAEAGFRPANRSTQSALARCAARDIKIHCSRVTSADNGLADALSRLEWPTIAQLCPNWCPNRGPL
ncbi:hypothetical protein E4U59_005869, partial [Claviceps monticola]